MKSPQGEYKKGMDDPNIHQSDLPVSSEINTLFSLLPLSKFLVNRLRLHFTMKFLTFGAALLGLFPFASASPLHVERMETSPALVKKQSCTHGPTSRNCWGNGFNADTDMYTTWPNTGRVVRYTLDVTNTTCNPDGAQNRTCLLFNNQMPGPTLIANWGDIFEITVRNKMQHNGTSIHWHGLRQLNSNTEDGVSTGLQPSPA